MSALNDASKRRYNATGLPLAPAAEPKRIQKKPAPAPSSSPPMQWDEDVPRPSMPESPQKPVQKPAADYYTDKLEGSMTQVDRINPNDRITLNDGTQMPLRDYFNNRQSATRSAASWKNPDGQYVERMPEVGSEHPVFKNTVIDPKLNKEYGTAIYAGGKGFTENDATTSGLDSAMRAAQHPQRHDFYGGFDARGLSPNQFQQFKMDELNSQSSRNQYQLASLRHANSVSAPKSHFDAATRRFVREDYAPDPGVYQEQLTDLQRDVRGIPRNGQSTTREEQLQDEQRVQQHELQKQSAINAPKFQENTLAADNNRVVGKVAQDDLALKREELSKKYPAFKPRPELDPKVLDDLSLDPEQSKAYKKQVADAQADHTHALNVLFAATKKFGLKPTEWNQLQEADPESFNIIADTLLNENYFNQPTGYAEGGEVQPPEYGAPPSANGALAAVTKYRDYVAQAQSMGLPVVPFEQFSAMQAGAAQGYAQGGMVEPDEDGMGRSAMGAAQGGKFVMDMNPNAPTDSIPATVDGTQPARLDSGEFVIPADVVRFFGLDRLNRMIAQARKSEGGTPQ